MPVEIPIDTDEKIPIKYSTAESKVEGRKIIEEIVTEMVFTVREGKEDEIQAVTVKLFGEQMTAELFDIARDIVVQLAPKNFASIADEDACIATMLKCALDKYIEMRPQVITTLFRSK